MRVLSLKIRDYVDKMSAMWVEGQVVQLQRRGNTAYLTLRDPEVDMSLSATISVHALNAMGSPLLEGARVVLQAKPTFWERRGTLQLDGRQIRPVGVGDLLARLEILKQRAHELAAILVEPVQSRRPDFRPVEFLRELRTLTEQDILTQPAPDRWRFASRLFQQWLAVNG